MSLLSLFPRDADLPLLTDLYQLKMAAAYHAEGLHRRVGVFELFVRRLPPNRSFLLTAGLEQLLHHATTLRFAEDDIRYLRGLASFAGVDESFFEYLLELRFRGDIDAMPEGTIAFANEPIVRVTATLPEAQLLETIAVNALNFATAAATKAARVVLAARGRAVVDFGMRRAHGPQAAMIAARAALIGGCPTTSNVAAARLFGVDPAGTMAHSWIMAHADEADAFRRFADTFAEPTTALVDTYDVEAGVRKALALGPKLASIRLDSGDLAAQARMARRILDEGGCRHTKIFASGDLNEFKIDALLTAGAPIDAFGVGTEMVTVADAPSLATVYKLVEIEDERGLRRPVIKKSQDKATLGGAKQVFRQMEAERFAGDVLAAVTAEGGCATCDTDEGGCGTCSSIPLLEPVVREGRVVAAARSVKQIAEHARSQIAGLPGQLLALTGAGTYPVTIHDSL